MVEVTSNSEGSDIIYYSRIGLALWGLVPNVFAMLIIDKQDMPSLQPNKFLWYLKRIAFSVRRKHTSLLTNPFVCVHFDMPHKNASLRMAFSRNRCQRTLWRTASSMHDHIMTWKLCKSSDRNSFNLGWTLRSHTLSLPILLCSVICINMNNDYKVDHQLRESSTWRAWGGVGT